MAMVQVILNEAAGIDIPIFTKVFKDRNLATLFTKKVILPIIGKQIAELS